jgi:hypothetical protein
MNRTAVILVFLCSLFILITLLEFYGTAQRGGNVELPHSTSLIGNSTSERMDLCSNRVPKNIFFDVGSNILGTRIPLLNVQVTLLLMQARMIFTPK